eukprot:CAMPEP_0197468784 /NCGR_PEP_ID=MMETSP1175-20131217/66266_1 /TAXON_ID=1003142 /ORGANISM="Triceratium dubium, Strain CCMP147" /LENGTH=311 /DNA_ID=CAMNT_0043004903 /DNA_START=104 /DNA_END=1039 /DNA_ORIENTATION=+
MSHVSLPLALSAVLLSPSLGWTLPPSPPLASQRLIVGIDTPRACSLSLCMPTGWRRLRRALPLTSHHTEDGGGGNDVDDPEEKLETKKKSGDQIRASTGIRPSLHPTTINAISEALLLRSSSSAAGKQDEPVDVGAEGVEPLKVALTAGRIASDALEKRTAACRADGDEGSIPTAAECQAVAGRVVGVVMRLRDLEKDLSARAGAVGWVRKYNEYGSFGVLKSECGAAVEAAEEGEKVEDSGARSFDVETEAELCDRIRDDPLFRMCRAECLLGLFIQNVEIPQLEQVGQEVAGGSKIDFIDEDRKEVLFS